jgi:serine/threonine protein kinase
VQEASVLAELSERTAAICQARDVGTLVTKRGDRLPYMVLEWLEGRTLEAVLEEEQSKKAPPRTLDQAVRWLEPIAEALALAHAKGIAHRDIKPSNIFILEGDKQGVIKLLDFGIAKVVQDSHKTFTRTGAAASAFTPAYGAPEQFSRDHGTTGPWTDVFALALVLTEIVSGKPALSGESLVQLGFAACNPDKRPTPRTLGARISDGAEAVFRKALAVKAADRYGSAGEFWMALQQATGVARKSGFADVSTFMPQKAPDLDLPDLEVPPAAPSRPAPKIERTSEGGYGMIDFSWEQNEPIGVEVVASPAGASSRAPPVSAPQRPPSSVAPQSSGLELAVPSRVPPPPPRPAAAEPFGAVIYAGVIAIAVLAATGLFLGLHRARGWRILEIVPAAANGSSVALSGGCAIATVVLCLLTGSFGALRERRSWGLVLAALGWLGMAIGFIVVTVSSPQQPGDPPAEGGFVVAYGAPLVALGLALALLGVGIRRWKEDDDKGVALVLAALGGACVFASAELFFGARP